MSLQYLLDTNILSEPLRERPNRNVLRRLRFLEGVDATAAPVWYELLVGCHRLPNSVRRHALERYLHEVVWQTYPVLDYTAKAAAWHAAERVRLEIQGYVAPFADGQIAAVAKVNELVLVTNNTRDFERFRGLNVENWFR